MTPQARKRVFKVVRLALCVGFVTLAVRGVTLHDHARLTDAGADGGERVARLLEETDTTITVLDPAGQRMTLGRAAIARDEQGHEKIERGLITALRSVKPLYLVCGLLAFAPVTFLQSARFRLMLQGQRINISYAESVKLCFSGNFLNFVFMLGSTAGDVYKAYYTAVQTEHKTEAVTVILLDRIVGLVGLILVAGTMSFLGSDDPTLRQLRISALVLVGGLLLGVWMVGSNRLPAALMRRVLDHLPGAATLNRVLGAAERLVQDRKRLAICVGIAAVLQFIAVGAAVVLAYALGMDFSGSKSWDYFAYIGGGHMIAAIPITAQGLGTMELAYKHFFLGSYGTLAQLLCLALWIRLMNLLWALPGALVFVRGAHRPRSIVAYSDSSISPNPNPSNFTP